MQEIDINLRPSKLLLILYTTLFILCAIVLVSLPWPAWLKLCVLLVTAVYCYIIVFRYVLLRHKQSILALHINPVRSTLFYLEEGIKAELLGESTVTRWICILRFKVKGNYLKRTCMIANDALEPQEYRRLLVLLRSMNLRGISKQNALPSPTL